MDQTGDKFVMAAVAATMICVCRKRPQQRLQFVKILASIVQSIEEEQQYQRTASYLRKKIAQGRQKIVKYRMELLSTHNPFFQRKLAQQHKELERLEEELSNLIYSRIDRPKSDEIPKVIYTGTTNSTTDSTVSSM